jgi:hypothetical protein
MKHPVLLWKRIVGCFFNSIGFIITRTVGFKKKREMKFDLM